MTENQGATCATITVPEAGRRYFNLSRNGAYAAAERGEIPVVRIGRLLRVPVRALEAMLDRAGRVTPFINSFNETGGQQREAGGRSLRRAGRRHP